MQVSDRYRPTPKVKIKHPEWSKNAVIYQINTRHFTREGTFAAAEKHLPRLKDLGVDVLWLMPIHEIGQKYRKGNLGSPYAVKDYYQVNSEFGTLTDIKQFVASAHQQGMYVILDWVANHTAWGNDLVTEHSDWYARDWKSDFRPHLGGIGRTSSSLTTSRAACANELIYDRKSQQFFRSVLKRPLYVAISPNRWRRQKHSFPSSVIPPQAAAQKKKEFQLRIFRTSPGRHRSIPGEPAPK